MSRKKTQPKKNIIPDSNEPIIKTPINVPKIVPLPPKTEVPPTKTAASVVNIKPSPCVGQKYNISYIVKIPAKAEKKPN